MEGGRVQQPQLVLAHNIFMLTLNSIDDIEKVRLRDEVFNFIIANDMAPLYETLVANKVLNLDQKALDLMRAKIDDELKKLEEKIADAEENLGESEAREAHLAKSLFYIRIGDKEKALEQLKITESKTVTVGQKMDLVFHTLLIGFFHTDFDLISKSIDKAKNLFEKGGDWERKNRLKVYEGLYCMSTCNFKKAADLFLDSISTFTTYELFPYDTFIFYTVLMNIISLDRVSLKQKVVDAPEIMSVIGRIRYLSDFLKSLYGCQYKSFFTAFAGLTEHIKLDRYLHPHFRYYMREIRTVVYPQFLESYKSVTIEAMSNSFGVTLDFIDLSFKVGHVISSIDDAKHVDQVIVALYSLAVCLFPLHPSSVSGSIDEQYRGELLAVEVPNEVQKNKWRHVFYKGSAFRAFARVLLYDVASNWLACFPASVRKHVYDAFFLDGCAIEIVQLVVPCLQLSETGRYDATAVCSNAERLLVLCLENDLILQIAREFVSGCRFEDLSHEQLKLSFSRVSQLITSIPDKARQGAPTSLSPHMFFKRLTTQLIHGAEERELKLVNNSAISNENHLDGTILFVGEAFSRICRRGSADVLLSEVIPLVLGHVRSVLSSTSDLAVGEIFESKPGFCFWLKIMEAVNDSHSVERIAEELLRQLAAQNLNVGEGYWILWILFGQIYKNNSSIRFTFVDKFLLWKVFPTCCLRWIIHFAVLECAPDSASSKSYNAHSLSGTVHRLVVAWSRKEFVQTSPTEQQAYVTAALGICLEKMTKEDLDATKDALHLILQGISSRLENPAYLIRKMASTIALVFSKIIDPKNPLYLDDSCQEEAIDWDFGLATPREDSVTPEVLGDEHTHEEESSSAHISGKEIHNRGETGAVNTSRSRKAQESVFNLMDPDEIIDPANLNYEHTFDEDDSDTASEDSETSSNSSLQPYDLTDDDADLKRKFSQLVDVVGALRKSDDAEGVEKALDVAEKFIRASPDELKYIAGDLVKALVQVRCTEFAVEGDEESAEEKRQKALVALIVKSPFEALDSLHKLLYSPNVDVSQRIMVLDVMTDAAQELASARILKSGRQQTALILSTSDQPWFIPRNIGPPGAGSWKEIPSIGTPLNWSYSYERVLPSKAGQIKRGKTRRWNLRAPTLDNQLEWSENRFPQFAAAFMLPAMQGFDKKRHGVDLLGRDFIVLGKLIYMLGICMKCAAMHPEASVLASPLLDMLRSREISHHAEAYVRRSVLFAASCVLLALHPSYVASAVVEGNIEISEGLEWIRAWALQVAESDTDVECHTLAMGCLQLHAEMALQASRALESSQDSSAGNSISLIPSMSSRSIKIPYLNS